jgi:hypothetical protein
MNIFSALYERIRRMFGPDQTPVSTTLAPRTEPIQPIVVTPAGNPVPPSSEKAALVIEKGAYQPITSSPTDPPVLQQPAPVITAKQEPSQEPPPAKTGKKPKATTALKEPKAPSQRKAPAKKKTN